MNKDNLSQKQQAVQTEFNNLSAKREDLNTQITAITEQLLLLKGEYNGYDKLIKELEPAAPDTPSPEPNGFPDHTNDPATTIEVKDGDTTDATPSS